MDFMIYDSRFRNRISDRISLLFVRAGSDDLNGCIVETTNLGDIRKLIVDVRLRDDGEAVYTLSNGNTYHIPNQEILI